MKKNRLLKNKRALSPVFSTILLIVIVVIGMTVAFGFFVNYVRDYQAGSGSSVLEAAEIEDVWFRHTNPNDVSLPVTSGLPGVGSHNPGIAAQQGTGPDGAFDTLTEANTAASIAFDNASSVEAATMAASVSWSHTTTTASNRLLIVAVNVYAATGTPTTVSSVTYGGVALAQVTTALYLTTDPQVRTYIFRLVNPQSGTQTVTVTFAASTLYVCGAVTYTNVDQTAPIQTSQNATGSSTSPSVPVTATGTGRAVFGTLAGYRTAETTTQVTYVGAGAGSGITGNPTPTYPSSLQPDDLILLQVTVRDTSNTPATPAGFTLLYALDTSGSTVRQWVYYKFATGSESGTVTITIGGSACKIARMYAFRNVALSSFAEGAGFRSGYDDVILAQSVTTNGDGRLAVSFVFVGTDESLGSFTGENGGDWTEAAEFSTTAGNNGDVQLQTATMASAGTISGGSFDMGYTSYDWGVRAFALKPKTTPQPWIITEGSGQNNRWAKETNQYKGRGSDKLNVAAGTVSMSWSTNYAPNWVCSAVVINPVASNYELNLEEQFTNCDYDEINETLCIYTGTLSSDERLQVYVSTEPVPLMTLSAADSNKWNNVSVSSYLSSTTFTIRFEAENENGDTSQSNWQIDCVLLHTWSPLSNTMEVWLYNYGKIDLKISSVYVDGLLLGNQTTPVNIGEHNWLRVTPTGGWTSGKTYHLKLVTNRGAAFEGDFVAP